MYVVEMDKIFEVARALQQVARLITTFNEDFFFQGIFLTEPNSHRHFNTNMEKLYLSSSNILPILDEQFNRNPTQLSALTDVPMNVHGLLNFLVVRQILSASKKTLVDVEALIDSSIVGEIDLSDEAVSDILKFIDSMSEALVELKTFLLIHLSQNISAK